MANLYLDGSKLQYHLETVEAWLSGENIFPVHVEISPSSACNQRCIICCVDFKGHGPTLLSRDVLLKLIDALSDYIAEELK